MGGFSIEKNIARDCFLSDWKKRLEGNHKLIKLNEKPYLIWEVIKLFYMCYPGRKAFASRERF